MTALEAMTSNAALASIPRGAKARLAVFVFTAAFTTLHAAMPSLTHEKFGEFEGRPITIYRLENAQGMQVDVMDYGATVVKIVAPDRNGKPADVVLGYDTFDGYLAKTNPYFGATVGRYANRLAKGQFTLEGQTYHVPINNGPNSLHGGLRGFDKHVWNAEIISQDPPTLRLSRTSPDGEEGYPGALNVSVTYTLTPGNGLKIVFEATTDKPTVLNLVNHSYFNLAGAGSGTVLDQKVKIAADQYVPVDSTLIPTGDLKSVARARRSARISRRPAELRSATTIVSCSRAMGCGKWPGRSIRPVAAR
jgi:aldose 1-epimerase